MIGGRREEMTDRPKKTDLMTDEERNACHHACSRKVVAGFREHA